MKKIKIECGADTFNNKGIDEFAKKKQRIDLQINFDNSLSVDYTIFSQKQ